MQTEYQDLLDDVNAKMSNLGDKPNQLGRIISEVLESHVDDALYIAVQESLHWVNSELYACTMQQVAFSVLDYQLGQDYLRDVDEEKGRYEIWDDTFDFTMTDNNDNNLRYDSIEEAVEEIHNWFSQQNDTESFSIYDRVEDEFVETIKREEDELDG